MSLSIVLGTETIFKPNGGQFGCRFLRTVTSDTDHTVQPQFFIFRSIKAGLLASEYNPLFLKGFSREVPSIVPPKLSKPESDLSSNASTSFVNNP